MKFELNQEWICIKSFKMESGEIAYTKGKNYSVKSVFNDDDCTFVSDIAKSHGMDLDKRFLKHFKLKNPTITIEVSKIDELSDNEKLGEYVRQLKNELSQ